MSEPDDLNALVHRYSLSMLERLDVNRTERGKSGWQWMTPKQLLRRAEQELAELRSAVERRRPVAQVVNEAADVGNFCAMLATVYAGSPAAAPSPGDTTMSDTINQLAALLLESNATALFVPGSDNKGLPHKLTRREANALAAFLISRGVRASDPLASRRVWLMDRPVNPDFEIGGAPPPGDTPT